VGGKRGNFFSYILTLTGGALDLSGLIGAKHELLKLLATINAHKLKNGHGLLRGIRCPGRKIKIVLQLGKATVYRMRFGLKGCKVEHETLPTGNYKYFNVFRTYVLV
jgi:hypothetical protein